MRPDLSCDAGKVLFAYCRYYPHVAAVKDKTLREELPEDSFYHLYEMNLDGTGVQQLTRGYYNDFDGRYLPDGSIVFLSTRKGVALQAGFESAQATCSATQPESYVRCGGDKQRPVPVFTLHRMDADGGRIRAISAFENFEWTPAVNHDGQILYARWDYIDRFNGSFMSLWSTRPDGAQAQLVYGNYTVKPQCVFEASRSRIDKTHLHRLAHTRNRRFLVLFDHRKAWSSRRPSTDHAGGMLSRNRGKPAHLLRRAMAALGRPLPRFLVRPSFTDSRLHGTR